LRGGWRRRQHKGQPYIPAVGSVGAVELAIALKIDVALHACHRKNISNLRADADDAGLEGAEDRRAAAVTGELLVDIADQPNLHLFGQELRRAPIEVHIDAVGISGRMILEIPGESKNRRELVTEFLVEIGVADAAVDRAMADADIRQIAGTVQADWNVAGDIGHVVIDAGVPAIDENRNQI